jgi:diketogulonate reductase-like aldo/keto reductase
MMNHLALPSGTSVPTLGLGTWRMGESAAARRGEVAAIRLAIDLGYRLFDTAEMYGEGGAEEALGQAVAGALRAGAVRRDELFIVSKVYPHNASRAGTVAACERSLQRLGLDHLDLYLLHWPGSHPLRDTVDAFERLQAQGRIRAWGVSNFDANGMAGLWRLEGGAACATNQVYYALPERGIEFDLLPHLRERNVPLMAYSPLAQGELAAHRGLRPLADALGVTPTQLALAWVLHQPGVMAIPKAVREAHLRENLAAAGLKLGPADLAALDKLFPPPQRKTPLAMV